MNGVEDVLREIRCYQRLLVTSHARPDGDAVGSVLACAQALRALGKTVVAMLHDGVPHVYRFLPHAQQIVEGEDVPAGFEAALILECSSIARTQLHGLERLFLINIDHHATGREFAQVNWVDPQAVATGELVFRLIQAAGIEITPDIATCLYTSLLTDTGAFCYSGTRQSTFALAGELVARGADPVKIAQAVYFSYPLSKMRLLGAALNHLHRERDLVWMYVTRIDMERAGAQDEDCEGIVNFALSIEGVEVAVFLRETPEGKYRVSLRSKGAINVAELATHFGGGGHECASGHAMDGPLSIAAERVLAQLRLLGYGTSSASDKKL